MLIGLSNPDKIYMTFKFVNAQSIHKMHHDSLVLQTHLSRNNTFSILLSIKNIEKTIVQMLVGLFSFIYTIFYMYF